MCLNLSPCCCCLLAGVTDYADLAASLLVLPMLIPPPFFLSQEELSIRDESDPLIITVTSDWEVKQTSSLVTGMFTLCLLAKIVLL